MKQQINLHQPIFRKQRALFSAQIVLRVCLIWIAGLALIYALSAWRTNMLQSTQTSLVQERDSAAIRLQELLTKQTAPGQSAELEAQIKRLKSEQAQNQGVIQVLARGDLGVTTGFATQLKTLAERRTHGVWLTGIHLRQGGQSVRLQGSAVHEDLLPEYLERLAGRSGQARFVGGRFSQVILQRSGDDEPISFELSTGVAEEDSP